MEGIIKRREIGSEFWDVPVTEVENDVFPDDTMWFISGTSALTFILKDILLAHSAESAAIPSWCCSCLIEPFQKLGIRVYLYTVCIGENGSLLCDFSSVPRCDITLTMSYFGYEQQINRGKPNGIVIRDLTHSIFGNSKCDADYYFGSLRKWAGFWTGGYAWKSEKWNSNEPVLRLDESYVFLRKTAMEEKYQYLIGEKKDKSYLTLFKKAEDYLDHSPVMEGSKRDSELARRIDVKFLKERRVLNAEIILAELNSYALFREVKSDECPLFVPLILEPDCRNAVQNYLIHEEIYCPIHWSVTDVHCLDRKQRFLYDHEISLVCDQRYDPQDMKRITACIKKLLS